MRRALVHTFCRAGGTEARAGMWGTGFFVGKCNGRDIDLIVTAADNCSRIDAPILIRQNHQYRSTRTVKCRNRLILLQIFGGPIDGAQQLPVAHPCKPLTGENAVIVGYRRPWLQYSDLLFGYCRLHQAEIRLGGPKDPPRTAKFDYEHALSGAPIFDGKTIRAVALMPDQLTGNPAVADGEDLYDLLHGYVKLVD